MGSLALLLWEPQIEGRNATATLFEIYFKDPFLAYVYIGSVSFFMVLYKTFKLLGYIRQKNLISLDSVKALRKIKYFSIVLVAFILGAEAYFFIVQRNREDIAGGVVIGLVLIFMNVIIGTIATVFEKNLQKAVALKTENEVTV